MDKLARFLIFGSFFLLTLLIVFIIIMQFIQPFRLTINTSRAAVIQQIRLLSRLETASFTVEKIIDAGTTGGNIFEKLLFGDKILLIAHGQVIAGFDLSQVSQKDVEVNGKSVKITLPPPQILVTTLDNTQTKVYDRKKGILAQNNDLESQARSAAQESIKKAACDGGILTQATENARKQITSLFVSLGFTTVTIEIPQGVCN